MPRLRIQGDIFRADVEHAHGIHSYDLFADVEQMHDTEVNIEEGSPLTISLTSWSLAQISDLLVFPDQPIVVTLNGTGYSVEEALIMKGTTITTLVLTNNLASSAKVRIIFGGPQVFV